MEDDKLYIFLIYTILVVFLEYVFCMCVRVYKYVWEDSDKEGLLLT